MNVLIKKNFNTLSILNVIYGLAGVVFFLYFSSFASVKSFAVGWLVAVGNFELLKRIGSFFLIEPLQGSKALVMGLMIGKMAFWGILMIVLTSFSWIQGIPFVLGVVTIVTSSLGLGIKESLYARTA